MSKNEILYQALNVLTDELIDRGWCDMNIQQLELDEISILKAIEFALPKNVFLTIDYNIDEDDENLPESTDRFSIPTESPETSRYLLSTM